MGEKPYDIFLSYEPDIQEDIWRLYLKLRAYGLNVWFEQKHITDTTNRLDQIVSGINGSQIFVNCVTRKHANNKDCGNKLRLAYDSNKRIIDLMFHGAELVDFKDTGLEAQRLSKINVFEDAYFLSTKLDNYSPKFDEFIQLIASELKRELRFDQDKYKNEDKTGFKSRESAKKLKFPPPPFRIDLGGF